MDSPSAYIEGHCLPRSVRWRVQMGLLNLPRRGQTFSDRNQHELYFQKSRYLKLAACQEADYIKSKHGLELEMSHAPTVAFKDDSSYPQEADSRQQRYAGGNTQSLSSTFLEDIQGDLARLNFDHAHFHHSRSNWKRMHDGLGPQDFAESLTARNANLMQLLHMYTARQGIYYQGMHEICSYLMFAIEIDLFDQETSTGQDFDGILIDQSLLCDTYHLFEAIMVPLQEQYEASTGRRNSTEAYMPYIPYSTEEHNQSKTIGSVSGEVYRAKWIRLMFSGEVQSWRKVFALWDVLLDLTTKEPSITSMDISEYNRPGRSTPLKMGTWEMTEILEVASVSLISLKRKDLFSQKMEHAVVEALIGCQWLDDVSPLISMLLLSAFRCKQTGKLMPSAKAPTAKFDTHESTQEKEAKNSTKRMYIEQARKRSKSPKRPSKSKQGGSKRNSKNFSGDPLDGRSSSSRTVRSNFYSVPTDKSMDSSLLLADTDEEGEWGYYGTIVFPREFTEKRHTDLIGNSESDDDDYLSPICRRMAV